MKKIVLIIFFLTINRAISGEVELLHFWTSASEQKSIAYLIKLMKDKGHLWKNFPISKEGIELTDIVLKKRVFANTPPTAAQIPISKISTWAKSNKLANLDSVALNEKWDEFIPLSISKKVKVAGSYVAIPVSIHRVNWMWSNAAILRRVGAKEPPKTWGEFFDLADKIKKIGVIPVAIGGQDWQEMTLFESLVLSIGGDQIYKSLFVDFNAEVLNDSKFLEILKLFKKIKSYTDDDSPNREWNITTSLLINNKAAFQFMGDWVKAEYNLQGKKPGIDYYCSNFPESKKSFIYSIDSVVMYNITDPNNKLAQKDLASALLSAGFQETFNLSKGSIPVRLDVSLDKFDSCSKLSSSDLNKSIVTDSLLPSISQGMIENEVVSEAIKAAVSKIWNDDNLTSAQAIKLLNQVISSK